MAQYIPVMPSAQREGSLNRSPVTPAWRSEPQSRRSSQSGGSETSPVSPTSSTGHTRYCSSSSSLSSSPPTVDCFDLRSSFPKKSAPALPDLVEDPMERDTVQDSQHSANSYSFDSQHSWTEAMPSIRSSFDTPDHNLYDYRGIYILNRDVPSEPEMKRRRSGESTFNRFTSRVFQRLPALTTKNVSNSKGTMTRSAPCSEVTSPVNGRSRSNSRARPLFRRSNSEVDDDGLDASKISTSIETIAEDEDFEMIKQGPGDAQVEGVENPREITRVSTPLLPLIMNEAPRVERIEEPTLQPPTVASHSAMASMVPTPHGTPQMNSYDSPALSSKASFTGLRQSQNDSTLPSSEIPAMFMSEPCDEWSNKLGHANFWIEPEPYRPNQCSLETCRMLLRDWDRARVEYSKHLCRTTTHYGNTSKTYKQTEAKWNWIDSNWRQNYEWAMAKASQNGEIAPPGSPVEPAPVVKIPSMDEKFPQISDAGIVGPMEKVAPQVQAQPSMKAQFMKMFDGLRARSTSLL